MKRGFVTISRTHFSPALKNEIHIILKKILQIFRKQSGLIDVKAFMSHDASQATIIIIWKDKAHHEKFLESKHEVAINQLWEPVRYHPDTSIELKSYQRV